MTAEAARMSRRLPTLVRRRDSPASSTRSLRADDDECGGAAMDRVVINRARTPMSLLVA